STNLRLTISGGGASTSQTFPINIAAGEVKKEYFFRDNPIVFEPRDNSYEIAVIADVIDPGSSSLPKNDCRLKNDKIRNRITWKVVTTERKFSMLWAKVGTLLDIGNYTPGKHFAAITTLGSAYISAVYPLANPVSIKSPIDIPPTLITAASDFLVTVLSSFGLPVDTVEPFLFLFELNSVAALLPQKRLMGVLPNKDWFKRFSGWRDVTGLSLGEFAPRAVIFLPRFEGENETGPQIALPAHELGHTFGLSVDSRLKNDWVCNVDWPIVGHSGCGFVGGFDEYKHEDDNLKAGNPANGYWVKIGNEPPEFADLVDKEQCDSHCFMGGSPINAWIGSNWEQRKRWVDPADYNHLIDKLAVTKDPEVIYVSGMIAWNNQIYVGRCFRLSEGVPDHSRQNGMYCFRFVDKNGSTLTEIGLPVAWNHAEFNRIMPVTFFGVTLEFPTSATKLEIWNRGTGTRLADIDVNRSVPEVRLNQPKQVGQSTVRLRWTARDKEQSKLSYAVMISPDGEEWWPAAHNVAKAEFMLDTKPLKPGEYQAEILALNSIRVGRSNRAVFRVEKPKP
ncbi:MAG TPA: hypothetical protein VLB68_28395, partial [Pyrinomonadaceae bacterium]|nr:hypothetical protein [Pyrinomonadaceae bacterium]